MTEKDWKKIPNNNECPFLPYLIINEKKRLTKLANVSKDENYKLVRENSNSPFDDIPIENLVLANEVSYEGVFIKFFKCNFLSSLNEYSLKIFEYLCSIIEIDNNKVDFTIENIMVKCKISEPRKVYDGLSDLIFKNIIAKGRNEGTYYINPSIVFRGRNRKILKAKENY